MMLFLHCRHLRDVPQRAGRTDPNAFWPGQLLDKLRLCMDSERKTNSVFTTVTRDQRGRANPGYDNNLNTWSVSDAGYVQYGEIK